MTEFEDGSENNDDLKIQPDRLIMAKYGRISDDMTSEFDIAFWQAQSFEARLQAGWELVLLHHELKGLPESELQFQRSVGSFQRIRN